MDSEKAPPNEPRGRQKLENMLFERVGRIRRTVGWTSLLDINKAERVHMSTVWPFFYIKSVKLSAKTAVDSNRGWCPQAVWPERGFNFGLLADPGSYETV